MKDVILLDFDNTITTRDTTRLLAVELIKLRPWRIFGFAWFFIWMALSSENAKSQFYKNRAIGHLLAGLSDSDLSGSLLSFAGNVRKFFRPLLMNRIEELKTQGALILIVTASPAFAVDKCVSDFNVIVLGNAFAKVLDRYTGHLESPNCYGAEKVRRIENWVKEKGFFAKYIEAWSDHFSDYPMLEMANKRFWVGDEKLRKLVRSNDPNGNFVSAKAVKLKGH